MLKAYYKQWRDSQSIVMAEMRVKEKYDRLLFNLAVPVPREAIPAVARQPDPRNQDSVSVSELPQKPAGLYVVNPLAAPEQNTFVGPRINVANPQPCVNAKFGCTKFWHECGGYKPQLCKEVKEKKIVLPEREEEVAIRNEENRKRKAQRAAERREEKKAAKEAAAKETV